ncbi:MAG: CvpA family protein [Desulfobulbaceae bacterium]|nr:MAG: CvpA family protein [Desulfobulbaceae bacterium]
MEIGTNLTFYDLLVLGLLLLLVARGLWVGFLKQIISLVALYFGYIVASQYHDRLFPFLRDLSGNPKVVFFASYALVFVATYILAVLAGKGLHYVVKVTMAGWFDRLLGGFLGLAKGVLLVVLMHMVLGTILAPENELLRTCETCDELNAATGLALELVSNEEARKALMQQVPAISVDTVKDYLAPGVKVPVPARVKAEMTSPAPANPPAAQAPPGAASFWDEPKVGQKPAASATAAPKPRP